MTDSRIFATHAPKYWQTGYSVVPVEPGSKKPPITNWNGYCNNLPGQSKREQWLDDFGSYGIGALLGGEPRPGSRIAAVDIDRDELAAPTEALLQSPTGKRGKKG